MNKMIVDELDRDDLTALILRAKKRAGLSWAEIASKIGKSPVWTHSAAVGMNAFPEDTAHTFANLLGLPDSAVDLLTESPMKIWIRRCRPIPAFIAFTRSWASMAQP